MSDIAPNQLPPPTSIWEVNQRLRFDEALEPGDPRWVDTAAGRGDMSYDKLYKLLGIDSREWILRAPPAKAYVLFCGHRGCGKSTELRRVDHRLNSEKIFVSILLDAAEELDPNNLQYQDVLLALAEVLLKRLQKEGIDLAPVFLKQLERWFFERIENHESTKEFAAEVKAGVQGEAGIPLLTKIFSQLTTAFRLNSTYKDELRRVVRNHFGEFARAFNQLILAAEDACAKRGLPPRVVFLVDGTDRLRQEDADSFFVQDVHQLQLIESLFLYSTPIHLLHSGSSIHQSFTLTFTLPMIKLEEKDGSRFETGWETMREILYRRAPRELFDEEATAERLVEASGGHPRDLLRLLQYTFQQSRGDAFERSAADRAVRDLATDYRRILEPGDYELLRAVDAEPEVEHSSERARELLYNLAILEYNAFWWRSHPAIRTLNAYERAGGS